MEPASGRGLKQNVCRETHEENDCADDGSDNPKSCAQRLCGSSRHLLAAAIPQYEDRSSNQPRARGAGRKRPDDKSIAGRELSPEKETHQSADYHCCCRLSNCRGPKRIEYSLLVARHRLHLYARPGNPTTRLQSKVGHEHSAQDRSFTSRVHCSCCAVMSRTLSGCLPAPFVISVTSALKSLRNNLSAFVSGEGHFPGCLLLDVLAGILLQHLMAHLPTLRPRVQLLLFQVKTVFAIKIANRSDRLGHRVKRRRQPH